MYKYKIYRKQKGDDPSNDDLLAKTIICTEYEIARLVERLAVQNPEYDYYFMRESGYLGKPCNA